MRASAKAINLIKRFEGFRRKAYIPVNDDVPTIGYGHTKGVRMGDVVTKEQAEELLKSDLYWSEAAVDRHVDVELNQDQFDALVSFVFNIGESQFTTSTLLKKLNKGEYHKVDEQLMRWIYSSGVRYKGLVRRREAEADLFSDYPPQKETNMPQSVENPDNKKGIRMTLKMIFPAFFMFLAGIGIANANIIIQYGDLPIFIPTEYKTEIAQPACLDDKFTGKTGDVNKLEIPLDYSGRYTPGDVDNDGSIDFVVANRGNVAAYDICGNKLWRHAVKTNWDVTNHVFAGWSSLGWVGDADGDGEAEYLHIGSDWRTLYVRNGLTGKVERKFSLGSETKWMYVLLGRRVDDTGNKTTRIFVTGAPGNIKVKSFDIRGGKVKQDWYHNGGFITNAYFPPQVANLNQQGGDEIVQSSVAISSTGETIWRHSAGSRSVLGAFHTMNVRDIDPSKPGLEAVYSVYAPNKNKSSLVSIATSNPKGINWENFSPNTDRHPHMHTVGDFDSSTECLETIARGGDGKKHWLVDCKGETISNNIRLPANKFPRFWDGGEHVLAIEWDEKPGTEQLYVERHTRFKDHPGMVVVSSSRPTVKRTRFFGGGIDVKRTDTDPSLINNHVATNSWFPPVYRSQPQFHKDDGPYEGNAHAMDVVGDGREEVVTMTDRKIIVYFNSGDAGVPSRRTNINYLSRKKLWCNAYSAR